MAVARPLGRIFPAKPQALSRNVTSASSFPRPRASDACCATRPAKQRRGFDTAAKLRELLRLHDQAVRTVLDGEAVCARHRGKPSRAARKIEGDDGGPGIDRLEVPILHSRQVLQARANCLPFLETRELCGDQDGGGLAGYVARTGGCLRFASWPRSRSVRGLTLNERIRVSASSAPVPYRRRAWLLPASGAHQASRRPLSSAAARKAPSHPFRQASASIHRCRR